MSPSTLYAFLSHDLLGNMLATVIVTGVGYTAKRIRARLRNRNGQTHHTGQ
ncbi:hypothetical protein OHU17_35560 (plasmid) [Streptomyces goshikiensis]|uniref:Uncharacterized protein n=1 Tax=Streptomyces goshikiensis TaxID=1942 RepID=A0ABZ1RWU3_9ACTN|nr:MULTISPECIES: hypothetical protein [Streptomyces]EDX23847.1 hypothetical protein SSAG_03532 [Streptomyces sp. Mg1]MBP0932091.1 hypothetical protein [Streptomyces sp. KCTC 0041BP]WBY24743.1 hypothetical protein PET44_34340 [Streptomyces goshikiensis]WSS03481.1 hypothetical protein OG224_35975 [Streptomyces goshikiensis]WSY02611.1 hypothetical protein OG590_35835 [Streptomyces goshikiensis]